MSITQGIGIFSYFYTREKIPLKLFLGIPEMSTGWFFHTPNPFRRRDQKVLKGEPSGCFFPSSVQK